MLKKIIVFFVVINSVFSARILGVFMFPSISHQIVYQPIWRELSLRGHQVTVVTPNPLNDPKLVNLTEIDVHHAYDILTKHRIDELLSKDLNQFQFLVNLYYLMDLMAEDELENPQFQQLLHDESQQFDLILIELFHPIMYGLAGRFKAPIIGISSIGMAAVGHDAVGNPTHPVLNPDMHLSFSSEQLTLKEKIQSCVHNVWYRFYYNYIYMPQVDRKGRKYFGQDIPYIGDLQNNVSLMFLNVNPLLFTIRPNVPAVIELGQMHIKPVQPLPQDLKQILDESRQGVVYLSLGTNVKSANLPKPLLQTIISALSELPYKILWKWESDSFPKRPDNVIISKWFPQQDILAHPNVKVFITQGGLQSIEEAISRAVPMIGMPFLGDQPMNVHKLVKLGIAVAVDHTTVTKDQFKQAIIKVAENRKFKERILEVKSLVEDKPMTGLEKAIWWTEYVIRHKGAKHLRSPAIDMPWYYYYLLDVYAVFFAIFFVFTLLLYKLLKLILRRICRNPKIKTN